MEHFREEMHLAPTLLPEDMLNVCAKVLTEKNQQVLGGVVGAVIVGIGAPPRQAVETGQAEWKRHGGGPGPSCRSACF